MKRHPFAKSEVERKYRKKFAQKANSGDTNFLVRLNKAKETLQDDGMRETYNTKLDKYKSNDGK